MTAPGKLNYDIAAYDDAYLAPTVEFWNHAFSDKHNFWPITSEVLRKRVVEKKTDIETFDPKGFLVAIADGRVIGMIHAGVRGGTIMRIIDPTWDGGSQGYIGCFGVLPEYRGRGVGRALFEEAERYLSGIPVVLDGQCLNPFWGNSDGPATPFWGTTEGISIDAADSRTLAFLVRRGYHARFAAVTLGLEVSGMLLEPGAHVALLRKLERDEGLSFRRYQDVHPRPGGPENSEIPYRGAGRFVTHAATYEGVVVGAAVGFALREVDFTLKGIYEVTVLNAFQGHGVGRVILGRLLEELKAEGARRVEVLTVPDLSPSGVDFYRSFGFTPFADWAIY